MKGGCLTSIVVIIINLFVGGWSVIEILSWFGKTIPFWYNVLIGLFVAEFSIPIAIIGWILRICGVF